jgi:hypothetical protein
MIIMSFYNESLVFGKDDELEKRRRHNQAQSWNETSHDGIEFIIRRRFLLALHFF